ncbi:MAG: hypothetical protein KGR98_13620 [Verrucomicrobia bacterium]|nr:hypothetical protein [Verrucomicrobiota bacterium]MDE3100189.1 hypothetical protein [Verrucomicrobiota bacterium]
MNTNDDTKTTKMTARLRWVMVFVIFFDCANTLMGQRAEFWRHPETMNEHNHLIHWIAAHGLWLLIPFLLLFPVAAFVFVSVAPTRLTLAGIFAFILCDYHGGATWLEGHWGLGCAGFIVYGILLAAVIVLTGFPREKEAGDAA